jgi:hypothetical protein
MQAHRDEPGATSDPRLIDEIRRALDEGRLDPDDVAALLPSRSLQSRWQVGAAQATLILGLLVVFFGAGLAYATAFEGMPDPAQLTTPFIFPLAALAIWALAVRRGRPRWEQEITAAVGLVALAIALIASWAGTDDIAPDTWGVFASLAGGAVALAMLARPPRPFAAMAGLIAAAAAFPNFLASTLGLEGVGFAWLQLALAALAAGAGLVLLDRARPTSSMLFSSALVLVAVGSLIGVTAGGEADAPESLTGWHVLLSLAIAGGVVAAAALRMPLLMMASAAAGWLWVTLVIPVAGGSAAWALVVVGMGVVIIAAGVLGRRVQRALARRQPG